MSPRQLTRRAQTSHTDDWLITYADTITLLLCLFVIILTIRTGEMNPTREAARPADPVVTAVDIFAGDPPFPSTTRQMRDGEASPDVFVDVASWDIETTPRVNAVTDQSAPAPRADPVVAKPELLSPPVMDLPPSEGIVAAEAGDRIRTLRMSSATFFSSGDATLSAEGKAILRDMAATLKSPAFESFHISIEGHTDDSPINTSRFQSNWELSTARAAAVVRFFLEQDIPAERLTAAGYADTFPIAPNRNADGTVIPENQASNRRVVIRLEKIEQAGRTR